MRSLRRPLAIVRILLGVFFIVKGVIKMRNADFLYGGLMLALDAAGRPFPFYEGVLSGYVDVHQRFFTYAIVFGQVVLGLSLVTGALVSLSAAAGALMLLNIALATSYGAPGRLATYLAGTVLLVLLGRLAAGLTWGFDRWLVQRSRSALVLLPLRLTVPEFQKS
jgi:uncharacterized membrane protein YphA (DoxX/SURF4 family)